MPAPDAPLARRRLALRLIVSLSSLLLIAALVAMPLLAGAPDPDRPVPDLLKFFGRFHPVILHLPIGILVIAALYDFGGIFSRKRPLGAGPGMLFFGAATAVFAAILGFVLWRASPGDYDEELVERHLWGGMAVAVGAVLAFAVKVWTGPSGRGAWVGKLTLFLTCGVMAVSSHDGGTLTHGQGYLTQYAPETLRGWLGLEPREAQRAAGQVADPAEEQVVYRDLIAPIFEQKCYSCHGPDKKKGRLRMDEYEYLLDGGREGEAIEPGSAEDSNIVIRMELPEDDEERMPPEGKKQITAAELAAIKWWLDAGASPTATRAELPATPEIEAALAELAPAEE